MNYRYYLFLKYGQVLFLQKNYFSRFYFFKKVCLSGIGTVTVVHLLCFSSGGGVAAAFARHSAGREGGQAEGAASQQKEEEQHRGGHSHHRTPRLHDRQDGS